MIVKEVSYEVADPTVDSQVVQLQASGANVFFNITRTEVRRAGDPQVPTTSAGSRCTT